MGQNLRARLQRIRETKKEPVPKSEPPSSHPAPPPHAAPFPSSFHEAGFQTLKRSVTLDFPPAFPREAAPDVPRSLAILAPDLFRYGSAGTLTLPSAEDLVFFDLETTGLSGGAGTVAFLAAFGRFVRAEGGPFRLRVDQYLLLDYPGEGDFLEAALKEFQAVPGRPPPLIVSYNGKAFDSWILKTRCLMNGISPPEYFHADLLHPARRLWRRMLPDCSQTAVETLALGLDRTGDVSGALAPDIWFSFLKTGEAAELLGVCDHNLRDIRGLASLFTALAEIARSPMDDAPHNADTSITESAARFRYDLEALALCWRGALKKDGPGRGRPSCFGEAERRAGQRLLEAAAARGYPRASLALARDLFTLGRHTEGRELLLRIAAGPHPAGPPSAAGEAPVRAAAFRALAMDAEWRLGDLAKALEYTRAALSLGGEGGTSDGAAPNRRRRDLIRRQERIMLKLEENHEA